MTSAAKQDKSGSFVKRQFLIFCCEIAHTGMHCKKEKNPILRRVRRRRRSDRFNLGRQLLGASFGQSHFLPLPPPPLSHFPSSSSPSHPPKRSEYKGGGGGLLRLQTGRELVAECPSPVLPLDPLFLHTHMHPFAQRRRRDGDPPLFPKVEGRGDFRRRESYKAKLLV